MKMMVTSENAPLDRVSKALQIQSGITEGAADQMTGPVDSHLLTFTLKRN